MVESTVYSGFAGNLLSIRCLWDSEKGSQIYWTQTHLWETDFKYCLSPMARKMSFVMCELRAFPSPSSCFYFFLSLSELIWKESCHPTLMKELLDTQKHWQNKAPFSRHFTVQTRAKVRGQQPFQGRATGLRNKFSSSCFREEVLKFLFVRKSGKPSYGSM